MTIMKMQFEQLPHQQQAINSTIEVFQNINFQEPLLPHQQSILLKNIQSIQEKNKIEQIQAFEHAEKLSNIPNFTIEMETGTGKTYVYIRSIFELHERYNLNYFIIVVPSVAINEGVKHTFNITTGHFQELYNKTITPIIYNSKDSSIINNFVKDSNDIKCMIINRDAFNKEINKLNNYNEKHDDMIGGEGKPISKIASVNPIIILDEPQNMATDKSLEALLNLNPKFILRYSATHKETYNKLYCLNPVDAVQKNLVKKIFVETINIDNPNEFYIYVKKINKNLTAEASFYNSKNQLETYTIKKGDNLQSKTKNDVSAGYIVEEINLGEKYVELSGGVKIYEKTDNVSNKKAIMQSQIHQVIKQHFKKQNELQKYDIKVLSLFFLDEVASYKIYNADKSTTLGELGVYFEQAFTEIQNQGRNKEIIHFKSKEVHAGYFSKDTKGKEADYELIMKDKERLLNLEEPVSFIFSHSALKEGWDNPNVFQICTLRDSKGEITKRQQIGRGLRICVNKEGKRVYEPANVNEIHIVASGSYEEFAIDLQKEYKDAGYQFNDDESNKLVTNSNKKKEPIKAENLHNEDFKKLWNLINHKTYYSINFDTKNLIESCVKEINDKLENINKVKIQSETRIFDEMTKAEDHKIESQEEIDITLEVNNLPNFITQIAKKTNLTKSTVASILQGSNKLNQISNNPVIFIQKISEIIQDELNKIVVQGISYKKMDETFDEIWEIPDDSTKTSVSTEEELKKGKTLWKQILLDSTKEESFVKELQKREFISFFLKLPYWFKIKTPVGSYNPDFACIMNTQEIAFVTEIKDTNNKNQLRPREKYKIDCAEQHFKALNNALNQVIYNFGEPETMIKKIEKTKNTKSMPLITDTTDTKTHTNSKKKH